MGLKLFDGGDSDDDNASKIEINQDYARRFEHNKKREDLQRLQELKKKGLVEDDSSSSSESGDESSSGSSSSSDDDVDVGQDSKKDLEFFNALIKVRSQDPSLKEKTVSLFESEDSDGDGEEESKERKRKLYLKDVVAKHLIEEGPDFDDEQTEGSKKKSYSEEQEEMRRAFLKAADAAEADGDDGDFLTVKKRDDGHPVEGGDAAEFQQRLDEYFGRSEGLGESEMFLKEFFLKKMWVDKDNKNKGRVNEEELEELLRDEEEIEKQEDYETNFRYEENAGDRVLGHSRTMEGSVRKKEKARKKQRDSKEERMKAAEMERKEELKHLKNLKKEEIKQKLEKFKQIAGIGDDEDCPLNGIDLDDDFDPKEYDRMMKQVFDEKYYNAEDVDPDFGSDGDEGGEIEKPDFKKEDELLGLPIGWDESESKDGFLAARERSLKHKLDDRGKDDNSDGGGNEEEEEEEPDYNSDALNEETISPEDGKRKRKRKLSLLKRAKQAMMEEYYKLDYEDTIGDLKTRFKYAKIKPNRYGLSTPEILTMDDKELNQYVSLKKLAPYQEKEWRVHNNQRHQLKLKTKELLEQGKRKSDKKKRRKDYSNASTAEKGSSEDGKSLQVESHDDSRKLSKNARRRRRQAGVKLSNSRLIAYGKIAPKSKGITKH